MKNIAIKYFRVSGKTLLMSKQGGKELDDFGGEG